MTQLPHVLKRIRLNLARSKEFPSGSDEHGYEFLAPLDAAGHIDVELWRKYREHCGVRRFWDGRDRGGRRRGRLISATTRFATANTSRSAVKMATCTPSRWSRSSRRREGVAPPANDRCHLLTRRVYRGP